MEHFSVSVVIRRCVYPCHFVRRTEKYAGIFLSDRPVENVENVDKSVDKKEAQPEKMR